MRFDTVVFIVEILDNISILCYFNKYIQNMYIGALI
jgi:hypothetical protein